ncbi:MAG: DUF444 family protein [Betaproteobacteria bacterium]|nr:DUF444 family protein [Betaproteobacteria bacterium]
MNRLVDRRLNGRNRSAVNRQRFIRRYKEHIRKSVKGMIAERSITDMVKGGDVKVPAKDLSEPEFRYGSGGDWESVHPGNREFLSGDRIPRPDGGGGGGSGSQGGPGESVDDFVFTLSREEFLSIFFDDLELPNMMRTAVAEADDKRLVRAGYVKEGTPSNLSVLRTMKSALGRRIALAGPIRDDLERAREDLEQARQADRPAGEIRGLEELVEELEARLARIPFLDEVDLRYRHRVAVPRPASRAVMFCLMDVSASMDERKKDLAKRFFTLLYLFLTRKYERVELVFIRHTDEAQEVDEEAFFYDPQSGGTVVFSALQLMDEICEARYPRSEWNIYAAQASDGDAFGADPAKSARFLHDALLPRTRYFAYIECPDEHQTGSSRLWVEYEAVADASRNFAMRRVFDPTEIYPVFRDLFRKDTAGVAA